MRSALSVTGRRRDAGGGWRRAVRAGVAIALGLAIAPAYAQDRQAPYDVTPTDESIGIERFAPTDPGDRDGKAYPVTRFEVRYLQDHPGVPSVGKLLDTRVVLALTEEGYIGHRPGLPKVTRQLSDIAERPLEFYYASAIQAILEQIRDHIVAEQLMGVFVGPDPRQIGPDGSDLRASPEEPFGIIITVGTVSEVRTLASGGRIDPEDRLNHRAHAALRAHSPVQPFTGEDEADPGRRDLLRRDDIDRYVYRMSRHPGRRVDVALSPALDQGGVTLDYLVSENKPWSVYAQLSNTGTDQTDDLRQRVGFFHNQLTGNDDILSLDYVTSGFGDEVNTFFGSYEAPVPTVDRLRWSVNGLYSEFTASEVGVQNDTFSGESFGFGGELIWNFFQHENLFLDFTGGFRWIDIETDGISATGREQFVLPRVGLRAEKIGDWYSFRAGLGLELQTDLFKNVDADKVENLGRNNADDKWAVLSWSASHSTYLEPLLYPRQYFDPSTPQSSTLAHEVAASFRGQYSFEQRLPPHFEQVAGGLFTVRGYPESSAAGDTVFIGSFEYRYHVPRAFRLEPEPRDFLGQPFRFAPQNVFGRPDWDLVLRGFVDVARVIHESGSGIAEPDETLLGAGVGVDLVLKRNFRATVDWAIALNELENGEQDDGDSEVHFTITVLY